MSTILKEQLEVAMAEIGLIEPWWSEDDQLYVFEHPAYPRAVHADVSVKETVAGYKRALKGFIQERLAGSLSDDAERVTSGRGGVRPGAGRPVGTTKAPTKTIRLPIEVAEWLQNPSNIQAVKRMIGKRKQAS